MPYSYCPHCNNPLHKAGKIKPKVSFGKARSYDVYYCRVCGYRTI